MEKISLPTKTKIAAWWMMIMGIMGIGYVFLFTILMITGSFYHSRIIHLVRFFLYFFVLLFLPSLFILKRKKIGWWFAIFSLIFSFFGFPYTMIVFGFVLASISPIIIIVFIILLILLLLDRKNFWKIAS